LRVLIEQEKVLHQYQNRQNRALVEQLIHPDFCEVGRSGTSYEFESIIEMMANESPSSVKVHSQNYECTELESSVQLLRYESALIDEHGLLSSFTKRCSIWVLVNSMWLLKYHQGTPCESFLVKD
jgi:hypothetical protein